MPRETTNYRFKKPLYSDNADVSVLNENFDSIDAALTPTINAATEPGAQTGGKLANVLGWIANRLIAITGKTAWQTAPSCTLEDCYDHIENGTHENATTSNAGFMSSTDKTKLDGATASNTSNKLVLRDSYGRAKVATPSDSYDIANKTYVDTNFVKKNSDTTMTAKLTAYSNTDYSTKQVRNIVLWTSGTNPPTTSYGDIIIKTF